MRIAVIVPALDEEESLPRVQAKAARAGLAAVEVPVSYQRRIGRSKITGTAKGTFLAAYKIISTILRYRFGPLAEKPS